MSRVRFGAIIEEYGPSVQRSVEERPDPNGLAMKRAYHSAPGDVFNSKHPNEPHTDKGLRSSKPLVRMKAFLTRVHQVGLETAMKEMAAMDIETTQENVPPLRVVRNAKVAMRDRPKITPEGVGLLSDMMDAMGLRFFRSFLRSDVLWHEVLGDRTHKFFSTVTQPAFLFASAEKKRAMLLKEVGLRAEEIETLGLKLDGALKNPDPDLKWFIESRAKYLYKLLTSPQFMAASSDQKFTMMAEQVGGTVFGKFAQILADDPSVEPTWRDFFEQFKSQGMSSRSLKEAQALVESANYETFGDDGSHLARNGFVARRLNLGHNLSNGTIGESYRGTYLHKGQQAPVIVKELKLTAEDLEKQLKGIRALLKTFVQNPAERDYFMGVLDTFGDSWLKELDFHQEAINAIELSKNAKNYKVAKPVAVGSIPSDPDKGRILILEMAPGVAANKLVDLLEVLYKDVIPKNRKQIPKENYLAYRREVEKLIEKMPEYEEYRSWLMLPETWAEKMLNQYKTAMNEQFLFRDYAHADPHGGNWFFHPDVGITFIDTGTVVQPDRATNARGSLGFLLGNPMEIAESIRVGAKDPDSFTAKELAGEINRAFFEKPRYLGDHSFNYVTMNKILRQFHIVPNSEAALQAKAMLQFVMCYSDMARTLRLSKNMLRETLKDIILSVSKDFIHEPGKTWETLKPTLGHVARQPEKALTNFAQFLLDSVNLPEN